MTAFTWKKIKRKVFKSKGMPRYWSAIGIFISSSALGMYLLSRLGIGDPLTTEHIFYTILLFIIGGLIVYYVNK